MPELDVTLWTIGHSTRSFEEFLELLLANEIEVLVDIRRYPGSRKYPHFSGESLGVSLPEHEIGYEHLPQLGGRRRPKPGSHNDVWRSESFRGYADYMETPEFENGIAKLVKLANEKRTAIMCSEAVWWRCHRSLVADYLKARGGKILHILSPTKTEEHPFTSTAKIVNGQLSYRANTLFNQEKSAGEKS